MMILRLQTINGCSNEYLMNNQSAILLAITIPLANALLMNMPKVSSTNYHFLFEQFNLKNTYLNSSLAIT